MITLLNTSSANGKMGLAKFTIELVHYKLQAVHENENLLEQYHPI